MGAAQKQETQELSGRPMSIRAFAEAAATSPRRVRRLIRQGRLRTVENQSGEVRVPESELHRLLGLKKNRVLRQSMELQAVAPNQPQEIGPQAIELMDTGPVVPLPRHEAAMVRLGFLESELACTRKLLLDASDREAELKQKSQLAEKDAVSATVRAIEAEHSLQELRTQVIDSTFRAMELQEEVKRLQERVMEPWYVRMFGSRKKAE